MVKKMIIEDFIKNKYNKMESKTKFGGMPYGLSESEWPISKSWDTKMMFICQIKVDKKFFSLNKDKMAYIFISHGSSVEDDFFDPDIIFPDEGENAVVIKDFELLEKQHISGPSIFDEFNKYYEAIPKLSSGIDPFYICNSDYIKLTEIEKEKYFNEIDVNKIGGVPNFIQKDEFVNLEGWKLLLQLNTNFLPFYLNLGSAPTMFVLIDNECKKGQILIRDL